LKIVAIHQPNFFPWLGYFHKIALANTFVYLDNVQYIKQSPASRNYIKDKNGNKILISLPLKISKGAFQNYNEIEIDYSQNWQKKILNKLNDAYFHSQNFNYTITFQKNLKIYHNSISNLTSFVVNN
jgi:hypothetical protein